MKAFSRTGKSRSSRRKRKVWIREARANNGVVSCFVCGNPVVRDDATLEHKVARANGGTDRRDNLAISHQLCNQLKGNAVLSDESKIVQAKVLRVLKDGPCQLGSLLNKLGSSTPQSIVHTYLRILGGNHIVKCSKETGYLVYSLAPGVEVDAMGLILKQPMRARVEPKPVPAPARTQEEDEHEEETPPHDERDPRTDEVERAAIDKAFGGRAVPHKIVFPEHMSIEPSDPPVTKADMDARYESPEQARLARAVLDKHAPALHALAHSERLERFAERVLTPHEAYGTSRKIVVRPEVRIAEVSVSVDHDGTVRVDPFPLADAMDVIDALSRLVRDSFDARDVRVQEARAETAQEPAGAARHVTAPSPAPEPSAGNGATHRKNPGQADAWAKMRAQIALTARSYLEKAPDRKMEASTLVARLQQSGVKIMGRYQMGAMLKALEANPDFRVDNLMVHLSAKS